MENYNLAVIGGGPGGYVAAIRAAQLGLRVALIEKEHLGGICLNWGCIPTKSLLKSAEIFELIQQAENFGIEVSKPSFNLAKMVARSRNVAGNLSNGIRSLLKKNKITIIDGAGTIKPGRLISIRQSTQSIDIQADNIIIATGARPKILSGFAPDGRQVWTSREAMTPAALPKSIIIIGAGSIGIEFASFYHTIGVQVTIIEVQDKILPLEDVEISLIARKIFEKKGIKIYTKAKLISKSHFQDYLTIEVEQEGQRSVFKADKLLMAIGIIGNTENLGLENTQVEIAQGHIVTDQFMRTSEPGLYAIGDVTGAPWLAHKASHEGMIAAEAISGLSAHPVVKHNIPACTYSSPQIASVGLTEAAALAAGYQLKIGRFPFMANAKASIIGKNDGLIKTIFDQKTGELLGAHMVGAEVTELIQGYVIAKGLECTELDLIRTIFPHPALSEMMHESVLQAYGRAVHI